MSLLQQPFVNGVVNNYRSVTLACTSSLANLQYFLHAVINWIQICRIWKLYDAAEVGYLNSAVSPFVQLRADVRVVFVPFQ